MLISSLFFYVKIKSNQINKLFHFPKKTHGFQVTKAYISPEHNSE